jgi:parvulin-like peptidyl-prolyl isomerase
MPVVFLLSMLANMAVGGVLIDRIAVEVDRSIIKDSDIERDIRVTEFLNHEPLSINLAERKKAANKLIDQTLIRKEIREGDYSWASATQANDQLESLIKQRYASRADYLRALQTYGFDEADLREQFRWQLTVLQFIEARFAPSVVMPGGGSGNKSKLEAEVNRLFFAWLDRQRKDAKIVFHEEGLA